MKDLCHDVFGVSKEKKDPKEVKGNRGTEIPKKTYAVMYLVLHIWIIERIDLMFWYMITELLDVFPEKRGYEDGGYISDEEKEVHLKDL